MKFSTKIKSKILWPGNRVGPLNNITKMLIKFENFLIKKFCQRQQQPKLKASNLRF